MDDSFDMSSDYSESTDFEEGTTQSGIDWTESNIEDVDSIDDLLSSEPMEESVISELDTEPLISENDADMNGFGEEIDGMDSEDEAGIAGTRDVDELLSEGNAAIENNIEALRDDLRDKGVRDGAAMERIVELERSRMQEELERNIQGDLSVVYEKPDTQAIADILLAEEESINEIQTDDEIDSDNEVIYDFNDINIEEEVENERKIADRGIIEKDATAYILRRNFATHLYILGLDESQRQYIMGHQIEENEDKRWFFRNEELLEPIARTLSLRPIVNQLSDDPIVVEDRYQAFSIHKGMFQFRVKNRSGVLKARFKQCEPKGKQHVVIKGAESDFKHIEMNSEIEYSSGTNIVLKYQREYEKKMNKQ